MFFSAYVGPESGHATWEAVVTAHARWLGCEVSLQTVPTAAGTTRAIARIGQIGLDGAIAGSANWVTLAAQDAAFDVRVPPTSPQHCYTLTAFRGRVLTDDLRLCAALTGAKLDPVGVYALLLYGSTPPPFTVLRGVTRLAGGHTYRVDVDTIKATRDFVPDAAPTTDGAVAEHRVAAVLDRLIGSLPANALLFFSGGVDSALLAARAARLGRRDLQLLNYAFSPSDPEAAHALRVASHLKLACERVAHDEARMTDVLGRFAADYAFPFGDLSTLPTNVLVHAALSDGRGGSTRPVAALEGTGADGAFGLSAGYRRYQRVFDMPRVFRTAGDAAYRWLRLWRRNTYLERALRFVRKSTRMRMGPAVMAHSALDGIAFDVPADFRAGLSERLGQEIDAFGESASAEERLSLLDLAWVCAGRMAPKTFDPLRSRGVRTIYPYLEPELVQASTSVTWGVKSARGQAKALLKTVLARDLPASLVYRAKSGFTPPYRTTLGSAPLQAFLHDVVLAADNPLLEWCDPRVIRDLVTRAGGRAELSVGAVDFLWALTFASGWVRQLPSRQPRHAA